MKKNVKIETKKAKTSNLLKTFSIFIQNVSISDPRPDPTFHAAYNVYVYILYLRKYLFLTYMCFNLTISIYYYIIIYMLNIYITYYVIFYFKIIYKIMFVKIYILQLIQYPY